MATKTILETGTTSPFRFKTRKVMFCFVNVFAPTSYQEGRETYNTCILIDKQDKTTLDRINAAIANAIEDGKEKYGKKWASGAKTWLRDGDIDKAHDENFAGKMFITAKSNRKPTVLDRNKIEIEDPEEFYSGCLGLVTVTCYPYNADAAKGVAFSLDNIMKLEDGERLAGASASAYDDFEEDGDELGADENPLFN